MSVLLRTLIVCLIGKDLAYVPFPYALRGVSELLCLAVGLLYPVLHPIPQPLARYWTLILYLLTLVAGIALTRYPLFVALQVASLIAVVAFFVSYFENQSRKGHIDLGPLFRTVAVIYALAAIAGLIAIRVAPAVANEVMRAGFASTEVRFRGLFSKASMMGAASGLVVGISLISFRRWGARLVMFLPALACLALTQSRTYWIASVLAGSMTTWRYAPRLRKWALGGAVAFGVIYLAFVLSRASVDISPLEDYARIGTVSTLTGRTTVWAAAIDGFMRHPLLGYGFTLGSMGFSREAQQTDAGDSLIAATDISRTTAHNGILQALLDSGAIGLVFYLASMILALVRLWRSDERRQFPSVFYAMLFFMTANCGESVIYSASVFPSVLFWGITAFALGLNRQDVTVPSPAPSQRDSAVARPFENILN